MKHQHGFSLVDALIGLLVLTLGLLAVLRGQPLLRQHAEIARQRSEAVRLAQEDIERQRSTLGVPVAGELIVDEALASTRYRLVRTVDAAAWPNAAAVTVIVHWSDRAGAPQQVLLATLVATPDPALAGAAVLPR
jgi:type II secretory pathway pseudopilin PulG